MVDFLAQLHSLTSHVTGVLGENDDLDVIPQMFDTYDGVVGIHFFISTFQSEIIVALNQKFRN